MTRTIMITCPVCDGEGWLEDCWPWFSKADGSRETCDLCHGSGEIEQELEPIEQEDLDR